MDIGPSGMRVTAEGESLLEGLQEFTHKLRGLNELETGLVQTLGLQHAIVVPGDADEDPLVLKDIGKAAAEYLKA